MKQSIIALAVFTACAPVHIYANTIDLADNTSTEVVTAHRFPLARKISSKSLLVLPAILTLTLAISLPHYLACRYLETAQSPGLFSIEDFTVTELA